MTNDYNPFRLTIKPSWLAKTIGKLLSLNHLANHYQLRPNRDTEKPQEHVDDFLAYTLQVLNSDLQPENPEALEHIPSSGPTIMVANHPLGGLEGVAMTQQLRRIRPDLKVLTNELLARIPEFSDIFIGVDVLSSNAVTKNAQGMRQVMKHLAEGGALLIYPAGMVSAISLFDWRIRDRQWNNMIGKLAKRFKATCVPFYVHGRNSSLFYAAGLIHPRLRTLLLPRELSNKAGRETSLTIGSPIHWKDIQDLPDADSITAYLRTATDLLNRPGQDGQATPDSHRPYGEITRTADELECLRQDITQLAPFRLITHREFEVYCAPYDKLGRVMHEIAVARERTFRAAGEGTGFDYDSDHFDPHYLHLFVWDNKNQAIVGAYRIGHVDTIIAEHGVKGLYSRSLYQFDEAYIQHFDKAMEVGRSFVSPEYQRHPRALDLLWQGIGNWVAKNPGYHTLFGCVSISKEHSFQARAFLKDSLMQAYQAEPQFLHAVRPLTPLKVRNKAWSPRVLRSLSNITLINKLLGQCDPGKSVPVLIRQYLALNGRLIGFCVNHGFNDSLDGLIMVDLRKTPMKYLQRYMGKTGSKIFIKQWSTEDAAA